MDEWEVESVISINIPNGNKADTRVRLHFKDTWLTLSQRNTWFNKGHMGVKIATREKKVLIRWDPVNVHFHELLNRDVVQLVKADPDAYIPPHKILNKVLKFTADMPIEEREKLPACMQQEPIKTESESDSNSDIEMDGVKWDRNFK